MSVTASELSRLPKWAQSEITRLRSNLASSEAKLAAAIGATKSLVEVDPHRQLDPGRARLFLPDNAVVRFSLPAGFVEAHIERDRLIVSAQGLAHGEFIVRPIVSNSIAVGFTAR